MRHGVTWVLCAVAVGLTGVRWVDLAASPVALGQSLSPLAGLVALVALCASLLLARGWVRIAASGLCVLVLLVHAAIWLPWLTDEPARDGRVLTVMSANLFLGRADTATIGRLVRSHDVDVLVLSEVRPSVYADLRRHGVRDQLPYAFPQEHNPAGTVLLSRFPTTAPGAPGGGRLTGRNPYTLISVGGTVVTVRAVHPVPPVSDQVRRWRSTLRDLADWTRVTDGPLIVAGDFNASVDHPGMRELLGAGMRDAHEVAGAGRPRTWPHGRSLPAFVHLDHVLVRGIAVDYAEERPLPGSDHDLGLVGLRVPVTR